MLTGVPDLDDKIVHYILVGGTLVAYHSLKYSLDWLVKKEFVIVRRTINFFKKRPHEAHSNIPDGCNDCPNRLGRHRKSKSQDSSDEEPMLFV